MDAERKEAISVRLASIAAHAEGRLTPEDVVSDAMQATSPLHAEFDWNVEQAAREHWIYTARKLIQSVRITVVMNEKTTTAPLYVRDPSATATEQGYVSVIALRSDKDGAYATLLREFARANAYLERAREIAVAVSLESRVDDVLRILNDIQHDVERVAMVA